MNASDYPNSSYYSTDYILTMHGSSWILDCVNFYPVTILGIFGFVLNAISFIFLHKNQQFYKMPNAPLYFYMKVYSLTNACAYFLSIFNISSGLLCFSPLFSRLYNSAWANHNYFKSAFKKLFVMSALKLSMTWFLVCILSDTPFYFIYIVESNTFNVSPTDTFTIWFTNTSGYASTLIGKILLYVCYAFKDVGIVLVKMFPSSL